MSQRRAAAIPRLRARMDAVFTAPPIPFRRQNGGDYTIPAMELVPQLGSRPTGFAAHLRRRPSDAS